MGSGVHVSHLLFLDFSLFSPLILAHFVSCIKYVMCFLKSNPRVVTSKVFAPVRSYKIVIVVILLETVKGSTAWHPFSKIALQIKTKSLQKTWTRVIPLLLFHKLIISDTKYRCQWHFFSLMSCTPPPKNHAHKRTLWWHDRDCLAQQYQGKKKTAHRCSSKIQASITSTKVTAWEPTAKNQFFYLYKDTLDASLPSRASHQTVCIVG